jgi:vancomycin resistance protein YoaR
MNYDKIYPGVSVGGVPLGGKTSEEAQGIVEEHARSLDEIELDGGSKEFAVSASRLGVEFDVRTAVDRAYAVGRQGGILKRTKERLEATLGTVSAPLEVDHNRERLREGLANVVDALEVESAEAEFTLIGSKVSVTPSRTGQRVDEEKLLDDIAAGLSEGRRDYQIPFITDKPELTTAEAEELKPTKLLGTYRTNYTLSSDKSAERVENLNIASKAISGTFLAPGEVFSVNEVAAPLEYNETKVIVFGQEEKADGGGLCQVSSTLYMAANYAGLEIVERHPHHAQLPYIRPGLDATVWFGALDMKFKNTTEGYLLLREYVADDGYIYAEIWGRPASKDVEMDSEPEYVGPDYSKWVTHKKVKENGKVVVDDVLYRDTYKTLVDEKGKVIRPDSDEVITAPVNP